MCDESRLSACVEERAPPAGVLGNIAIEAASCATVPRKVPLRAMRVGFCERNAVVAKEHPIAVRLVALTNVVTALGSTDLDASADVGELGREFGADPVRVARSQPDREQVDIRHADSRLSGHN